MKQYYWAEGLDDYKADNEAEYNKIIEIKRLNFFIGKNNAGKSRFLRQIFKEKRSSSDNTPIQIEDNFIQKIKNRQTHHEREFIYRPTISSDNYRYGDTGYTRLRNSSEIDSLLEDLQKKYVFPAESYSVFVEEIFDKLKIYSLDSNDKKSYLLFDDIIEKCTSERNNLLELLKNKNFIKKFYTPILRGMRPISKEQDFNPYISRTLKDYFDHNTHKNSLNTGEALFEELSRCLLGEPEERYLIRSYEQKLSQYFFDNQIISLIPKYQDDVVYIKIGNDKQFPIYLLGDGLQQAIILTYEAFIKKDEIHAFFIEEPELHMHPGMLRQLMNFYLNETPHYYFFTTHSNHLLDMVDESDEVIIQKFTKTADGKFQINRCDKDRDLLAALGVKPSSVYLANCTIWVEGITDRLYIAKYMQKYLEELKATGNGLYEKYRRFMPNYHYAFVEYAGGNIAHWNFDEVAADQEEDRGLTAKRIASDMLLIADGDNKGKADRVEKLEKELKPNALHFLECKEIENTLPTNIIIATAKDKFSRMQGDTKDGFDVAILDSTPLNFYHSANGIGRILDNTIRLPGTKTKDGKTKYCFGESSGTIKDKLGFCRLALSTMEQESWQLTDSARALCEKIFQHIENCNTLT